MSEESALVTPLILYELLAFLTSPGSFAFSFALERPMS